MDKFGNGTNKKYIKYPIMFECLVFATWFNYFDHATYVNFFIKHVPSWWLNVYY